MYLKIEHQCYGHFLKKVSNKDFFDFTTKNEDLDFFYVLYVDYMTGNSYGTERTSDVVAGFESITLAYNALEQIAEHAIKSKDVRYGGDRLPLKLELLDGVIENYHPFWIGYFEELLNLEIKVYKIMK